MLMGSCIKSNRLLHSALLMALSAGLTASTTFAGSPVGSGAAHDGAKGTQGFVSRLSQAVPSKVSNGTAQLVGKHADGAELRLLFQMPFRNEAGLTAFIDDVSNPKSSNYGHYLTLAEENARFSPDPAAEARIMAWLQKAGVSGLETTPNHLYVGAKATSATWSTLLHVQINDYQLGSHMFYSVDRVPVVPTEVQSDVQWITGLSNSTQFRRMSNGTARGAPPYHPQDIANAYNVNPLWNAGITGAGSSLAITLWGAAPSDSTLNSYGTTTGAAVATRANGRLVIVPIEGGSTYPDVGEAGLDIESAGGMAYQAQIRYYEAPTDASGNPTTLSSLADALNTAGTDASNNRVISNSWGGDEDAETINAFEPIFRSNSATGHNYIFSSGDAGSASSFPPYTDPVPSYPSSSPYVTSVGGTRFTANIGATYPGERTWDYIPASGGGPPEGSGGGFSGSFNRPSWQVAPGFNNPKRGQPDISAVGDPATGYYIRYGNSGAQAQAGGTSLSAPLWAGMQLLVNQYLTSQGKAPLGFANPSIYVLDSTTQPYAPFHDITVGTNGAYNAGPGWDAVTGVGTPDLWNVARDLAACNTTFVDMPPATPYFLFGRCLVCRGIMSGYACGGPGEPCDGSNGTYFRPNASITRGQISKIVSNAAGYGENPTGQQFQDVAPGSPFYAFVYRLATRNIMSGYPCGGAGEPCGSGNLPYFRPNGNASRGQLSKIVSSAAGYNEGHTEQTFQDVPTNSTFYIWIQRLSSRGFISGYPCGGAGEPCGAGNKPYFRSSVSVSRGQASKIVSNAQVGTCQP